MSISPQSPLGSAQPFATPADATGLAQPQAVQQQQSAVDPTNLPRRLWYPLWQLLMGLEREDEIPRRYEVKEILKRRLFFRGEQYWFYNEDVGSWLPPTQAPTYAGDDFQEPAFQHVTNIIQPYALSLCSVLSQNNVNTRFWPEKASDPQDVQFAKKATKVSDYIHRNNDWQNRVDECTYYMCTDGFFGSYSRYVSDADRFGVDHYDILAATEVEIGPASVACPECGYTDGGTTNEQPTCPQCGAPLADIPAQTATVPQKAGEIQLPKGQEVVSIVPALQLKRTMWADDQKDFLYLDWITDLHKSVAMAAYADKKNDEGQELADLIDTSAGGESDGGTANTYERIARRLLYLGTGRHSGMVLRDLGTFRRAWVRQKALYGIKDKAIRDELLALFPNGVKLVFFNDVYCESLNESMDEKWETMHTCPGEGQNRQTLVSAIIPAQEMLNDAVNLLFEICMYGVPEGFADADLLDTEARNSQAALTGNITPTKQGLGPGGDIRAKLMFTPAVEPSAAMMKFIEMLFTMIPQFLTGAFPALFGGDTGANDTASGIAIQRNQALGRIGRAWRRLQLFLANTDAKSVRCFAKNRTEDVDVPKQSPSGDNFENDVLSMDDMRGNVVAYPELDAQYPTLEADVRNAIMGLWNGANPIFLSVAQDPKNLEYIFRMMGVDDIQVPGEDQRKATYKDIEQLVTEQPQQGQTQPTAQQPGAPPDQQQQQQEGGAPPQQQQEQPQPPQPQMIPSVEPDPDAYDLKVAGDTAKAWLISDAGLDAKQNNPAGYENVKLYAKACDQLQKLQMFKQAIAAQAMAGQGPAADLGGAESMQPPPHQVPPGAPGSGSGLKAEAPGGSSEGETK